MGDSLDDLNFPRIAERLFETGTITRRRPKPRALGTVKRWKFIFHMENGRQETVGDDYIATEPEAMWEGENRLFDHEHNGGETPASIEVQSQGKHNAEAESSAGSDVESTSLLACPFCGRHAPGPASGTYMIAANGGQAVRCPTCNAHGPLCPTFNQAIAQWNHRQPNNGLRANLPDNAGSHRQEEAGQ
jgi:hypothetical protein